MVIFSIALVVFFGGVSAYYAQIKGRDPVIWFVLGSLSFLISILLLYFLPPVEQKVVEEEGVSSDPAAAPALNFRFREWFYLDPDHTACGPLTFSALRDLYCDKVIESKTFLWSEGLTEWTPLESVEDLKDYI